MVHRLQLARLLAQLNEDSPLLRRVNPAPEISGLATCAFNIARPLLAGQAGRACFDAVAPLLLIGRSDVGPRLLVLLHRTVPDADPATSSVVPDEDRTVPDRPGLSSELLVRARELNQAHRQTTGKPSG